MIFESGRIAGHLNSLKEYSLKLSGAEARQEHRRQTHESAAQEGQSHRLLHQQHHPPPLHPIRPNKTGRVGRGPRARNLQTEMKWAKKGKKEPRRGMDSSAGRRRSISVSRWGSTDAPRKVPPLNTSRWDPYSYGNARTGRNSSPHPKSDHQGPRNQPARQRIIFLNVHRRFVGKHSSATYWISASVQFGEDNTRSDGTAAPPKLGGASTY